MRGTPRKCEKLGPIAIETASLANCSGARSRAVFPIDFQRRVFADAAQHDPGCRPQAESDAELLGVPGDGTIDAFAQSKHAIGTERDNRPVQGLVTPRPMIDDGNIAGQGDRRLAEFGKIIEP